MMVLSFMDYFLAFYITIGDPSNKTCEYLPITAYFPSFALSCLGRILNHDTTTDQKEFSHYEQLLHVSI